MYCRNTHCEILTDQSPFSLCDMSMTYICLCLYDFQGARFAPNTIESERDTMEPLPTPMCIGYSVGERTHAWHFANDPRIQ